MKKIMLVLVFLLVFCSIGLAEARQIVQVEQLKMLEEKDDFPIRIIKKEITANRGDSIDAIFGSGDLLSVVIENDGDVPAYNIRIYAVAYDEDKKQVEMGNIVPIFSSISVIAMENGKAVMPQEKYEVRVSINDDNIDGIRMVVDSYEDDNGQEVKNALSEEWLDSVFESNRIKLD